jgi:hypothetical protein
LFGKGNAETYTIEQFYNSVAELPETADFLVVIELAIKFSDLALLNFTEQLLEQLT